MKTTMIGGYAASICANGLAMIKRSDPIGLIIGGVMH